MTKRTGTSPAAQSRPPRYPWAELYDLESRIRQPQPTTKRGKGRPTHAIPRHAVCLSLTDTENRILAQSAEQIRKMLPGSVSKSQAAGLAFQLLSQGLGRCKFELYLDWNSLVAELLQPDRDATETDSPTRGRAA